MGEATLAAGGADAPTLKTKSSANLCNLTINAPPWPRFLHPQLPEALTDN
uniref:Uncharacterized protein n=1 Tax=Arundo donax TaxID=35708 RepID=A0A0A9FA64_ARUDO